MPHLGHVHLKVRDIDDSVAFYTEVLGLDVTERHGRYAFLSFGDHHHDVALQEVAPDAQGPTDGVGLYHAAFEVADPEALSALHERLSGRGVAVSPVDHGISKALYFDDPSGNGLETYVDTRDDADEEWRGRNRPFEPADAIQ
ncbi:VOC family protein [Natronomonas marina]|jgi:catechol 2,3-dioxygenase|uniref:VOC family protein n=1 Tax=Natronomonas marina TaxID=2961939 RepID=UPI0020CA05D8|nr:VOC family protein [Natronomonas marina]